MGIASTANVNLEIDTRLTFVDGGFCEMTKPIRFLRIIRNEEVQYFCSNLFTFSDQLCPNTEKFRVEQQQTCIEPNIILCKYDMKLILLNFNDSDEGIYSISVEFENNLLERGMLMRQFNITLSSRQLSNGKNKALPSQVVVIALPIFVEGKIGLGIHCLQNSRHAGRWQINDNHYCNN